MIKWRMMNRVSLFLPTVCRCVCVWFANCGLSVAKESDSDLLGRKMINVSFPAVGEKCHFLRVQTIFRQIIAFGDWLKKVCVWLGFVCRQVRPSDRVCTCGSVGQASAICMCNLGRHSCAENGETIVNSVLARAVRRSMHTRVSDRWIASHGNRFDDRSTPVGQSQVD